MRKQIVALSGGKDSTALALLMAEQNEDFELFFTPTFDELPECIDHIALIKEMTGRPLVIRRADMNLDELILHQNALPNNRQRWCTRILKIEPCKAYLLENPGSTLLVGAKADEEEREGMWGSFATYRYPLREKGWGIDEVNAYNRSRGVIVPDRTDCSKCYDQRLSEWWKLWKHHPDRYAHAEQLESETGHTFRSETRDTWPASLREMRLRFEAGDIPTKGKYGINPLPLFGEYEELGKNRCRVCSL